MKAADVGNISLYDFKANKNQMSFFSYFYIEDTLIKGFDKGTVTIQKIKNDAMKAVNRYDAACEMVEVITEEEILRAARLFDLKRFLTIKANDREIMKIIGEFNRDNATAPNYDIALTFSGEDTEAPADQGGPYLRDYPPFVEMVEKFRKRSTRKMFSNTNPEGHLRHTLIPRTEANLSTREFYQKYEDYGRFLKSIESIEGVDEEDLLTYTAKGKIYGDIRITKGVENEGGIIAPVYSAEDHKIIQAIYAYAQRPENSNSWSIATNFNPPLIEIRDIPIADVVKMITPEKTTKGNESQHAAKVWKTLIKLSSYPQIAITHTSKDVSIDIYRPIMRLKATATRKSIKESFRVVTFSITMVHDSIGVNFHTAAMMLEDNAYSLYRHIYTVRNQRKATTGEFYNVPFALKFTVKDLIFESGLEKTFEGSNPRVARQRLRKYLNQLIERGFIKGFEPAEVPRDIEEKISITFDNEPFISSKAKEEAAK